jgi:signal transduction histidine kinase
MPTTLETVGEPSELPGMAKLSLFRIAQEALTNARKYAGPGATADVRVRYLDGAVELEVSNTGNVPSRPRPGGLGQIGMRERVDALGGTLEVGPRSRGGYLVRAQLPAGPSGTDLEASHAPKTSATPDATTTSETSAAPDASLSTAPVSPRRIR